MTDGVTLSLRSEVERLETRVEEIKQEAADVEARIQEARAADDRDPAQEDLEAFDRLDQSFAETQSRLIGLRDALEDWTDEPDDDAVFEVKALTWGELMRAKDEVNVKSYEVDRSSGDYSGVPRSGYYKVHVVQLAVTRAPPAAPADPEDYPFDVGEWLYETVDDLNTTGGEDLENLSLRAALE